MSITAIPGFEIQKTGKNKYLVTNGQSYAVLNKKELKTLGEVYGVKPKGKKVAKAAAVLAATGALVAAVAYRKNIGGFLDKAFKNVNLNKTLKSVKEKSTKFMSDSAEKVSETAKKAMGSVEEKLKNVNIKTKLNAVSEKMQSGAQKINEKAGKWYNKTVDFVVNVFGMIKKFFNGLFGKKSLNKATRY